MRIAGVYSFNGGVDVVNAKYSDLLKEIENCIGAVDASKCKTKESEEKTMPGTMLFAPVVLNTKFKERLYSKGWKAVRVKCDYPTQFYSKGYTAKELRKGAFRERV